MKEKMQLNTADNETADELANMGADLGKGRIAEWLASEMHDAREKVKQFIQDAVHLLEGGGEHNDMPKLEDRTQDKNNLQTRRAAKCEHVAAKPQVGAASVQ